MPNSNRRDFLKTSSIVAAAGALAGPFTIAHGAFAAGSDVIKVGLVGCGGRGSGAAVDALSGDPGARLVALGDIFKDKIDEKLKVLLETEVGDRVQVPQENQFSGWDAYKHVIDAVDVVLLCSPPHFRPAHLEYAIDAKKHIFCEKPVAVDAPGVRRVFAAVRRAEEQKLSLVSGLCWRYDYGMRATFDQIHNGAVGDIRAIQATYNTSTLKKFPRQAGWSEMEFQLRNWNGFAWLSGDFNTEQHVHSIDKVLWAMKDEPPVSCVGSGGRIARTGEESGHVYDHFNVVYEFANGVKAFANCRQIDGCDNDVSDHVFGSKGVCHVFPHVVTGETSWKFKGQKGNMYRTEHKELFESVRKSEPINNGDYMTKSTMMAIMGRMSAYTGKALTWDQALNSKEDLTPPKYEFGDTPIPVVAVPGITRFV